MSYVSKLSIKHEFSAPPCLLPMQWHQHPTIFIPNLFAVQYDCMRMWHTWFSTPEHGGPSTSSILILSSTWSWFSILPRPDRTCAGKWRLCLSSWWRLLVSPQWPGAQSKPSKKHIPDFELSKENLLNTQVNNQIPSPELCPYPTLGWLVRGL